MLACITSCGASVEYSDSIAVSELAEAADSALSFDVPLIAVPDDYIIGMMEIDVSEFAEHTVKIQSTGANIDEYGILKAASADDADAVKTIALDYIAKRVDNWNPQYMPEELPKLKNATVKVYGSYVVYCILDDASKEAVFKAIESKLVK